jgi:hypothetical protein
MPVLLTDDRSYLYVEHAVRWQLGDPADPALTLNDADAHGCAWLTGDVDGWDDPAVDLPMDRRPDGHGGFAGQPTYEPRTLSVEGSVTAPSPAALADAHRRLRNALLGGSLGRSWRWTAADEDGTPGLWVQQTGKPLWRHVTDRAADFAFTLLAEDPIKTGAPSAYGPVRLTNLELLGGYPMGAEAPWTSEAPPADPDAEPPVTVIRVDNAGDEDAHALYRITGPVPQPMVQLTNGYVHLRLDLLTADDVAEVDTYTGSVTVNGQNRYDAWGPGSTFPLIPPGGADVRLRSLSGGADPTAKLTVVTAPAWR